MTVTPYQLRAVGDSSARNAIINGNFDFWQRGTSVLLTNSGSAYQADRFSVGLAGPTAKTTTYARIADAPTQAQSGFNSTYSAKLTNGTGYTSASTDTVALQYVIEGNDYAHLYNQRARIQFWVKSSVTGIFSFAITNGATVSTYVTTYTINLANTWEKKVIDINLTAPGTWNFDNTAGAYLEWTLDGGSSRQTSTLNQWYSGGAYMANTATPWAATTGATWQIAQVMVTPGAYDSSANVTFQRAGRSIGHELVMCQRYYEKSYDIDITPGTNSAPRYEVAANVSPFPAGACIAWVSFEVRKRAASSVIIYPYTTGSNTGRVSNGVSGADYAANSGSLVFSVSKGFNLYNGSGGTLVLDTTTTGGAYSILFGWSSDSEL